MKLQLVSIVVGLVGMVACAGAPAKAPPGQALVGATSSRAKATDGAGATGAGKDGVLTPGLHVSPEIARLCGLPDIKPAPHFEYDSTALAPEDRDVLAAVAKCMSDGALRGKSVELVGRTDPRGETEYNFGLGEARADSVRRYLHDLGIAPDRLAPSSRGELDANGTSDETWALDRRVDIELASM